MRRSTLCKGSHIRVIAPSRTLSIVTLHVRELACQRLADLGLSLSFGEHVEESDALGTPPLQGRLADLHDAFADPEVDGILTAIGGYSANALLPHINWELLKRNPKPLCGFSDITALQNGILAKAGLVSYSGPHFSTFGCKHGIEYVLDGFRKAVMAKGSFWVESCAEWSDDAWYLDQDDRTFHKNEGPWILQEGEARGRMVGGNLGTLMLLAGTHYFPNLSDSILLIEDDFEEKPHHVDRLLQGLLMQPGANRIRALLIGRFEGSVAMSRDLLEHIIASKALPKGIPVVANLDFGHTMPFVTLPIGGLAELIAEGEEVRWQICEG